MTTVYNYLPISTIVQDALVTLNQSRPAGVYDSQDGNAVLMGALANQFGPLLADAEEWQQFRPTMTVTGDGSATEFDLPDGFSNFITTTGWSITNRRPVEIVNAQQWAASRAWIGQTPYITPACRLFNNKLQFVSAPALNEVITFEYLTRNWVLDQDGVTTKERLVYNADVPLFDALLFTLALKWKWAEARGMATQAYAQDFADRFSQVTGRNQDAGVLFIGAASVQSGRLLNGLNIPETDYGIP